MLKIDQHFFRNMVENLIYCFLDLECNLVSRNAILKIEVCAP